MSDLPPRYGPQENDRQTKLAKPLTEKLSELAPVSGSAANAAKDQRLAEMMASIGLGPRPCADCGKVFAVPPYAECNVWKYCDECADRRLRAWLQTAEGQKAMEAFKQQNDQAHTPRANES